MLENNMFQSIVVAIDGSMQANRALSIGAELAAKTEAQLGLVYVVDSNHMEMPDDFRRMSESEHVINPTLPRMLIDLEHAPANLVKSMGEAAAESQRSLYQFAEYIVKQAKQDAKEVGANDIETSIEFASPAERIIAFAKSQAADLIITGRHGYGSLKSLLLGSTSHKVTQLAECSCMTVT
jgi:nucleotide-binding universal stress UspA family protein